MITKTLYQVHLTSEGHSSFAFFESIDSYYATTLKFYYKFEVIAKFIIKQK